MRNRLYHRIFRMQKAVEDELYKAKHRCGSAHPEYQKLLRISVHMDRVRQEYAAQEVPLCPPIIRTHWGSDAV